MKRNPHVNDPIYRATSNPGALPGLLRNSEHVLTKHSDGSFYCQTHACPGDECASRSKGDIIWTNSLDGGTYKATVVRTAPYQGLLTLTRGETCVLECSVSVSYDAPFGADAEDVINWQQLCVRAADGDYARRGQAI